MPDRRIFSVSPIAHGLHLEAPPFNAPSIGGQWPTVNVRVNSNRIERRWDHSLYRTFADGDTIQNIPLYRKTDGTTYLLALTGTDLCRIRTGTDETYSFLTDTYITGGISAISGTALTGSSTAWDTAGIKSGDKFILEEDLDSKKEPVSDPAWATVASVDSATGITLDGAYGGTTGDFSADPREYRIRKLYSCPATERWQYATVNGKFCFVNGNVNAQYWAGADPEVTSPATANFAAELNGTYAKQAKYCIGYANRLILAHLYDTSTAAVNPWLLSASELDDPTDFYGDSGVTTAANYRFAETDDPITGLGVVENSLIVYKRTGFHVGYMTTSASDPLTFPTNSRGVGLYAPYSLVHFGGTNAWLGADDFYVMSANKAVSIGGPIRKKFFEIVEDDDLDNVVGMNSLKYNEIYWVAQTSSGQEVFVWNYKENQPMGTWTNYSFDSDITGVGGFGGM